MERFTGYQRDSLGRQGNAANGEIHWFIRDIHWVQWEMLLRRDSHRGIRDSLGTLWDAANERFIGLS